MTFISNELNYNAGFVIINDDNPFFLLAWAATHVHVLPRRIPSNIKLFGKFDWQNMPKTLPPFDLGLFS